MTIAFTSPQQGHLKSLTEEIIIICKNNFLQNAKPITQTSLFITTSDEFYIN